MYGTARRILLLTAGIAVLGYLSICFYMWRTQRQHIFEPSPVLQTTPDKVGMPYQEVHIPSGSDGKRGELDGWWIPAKRTNAPTLLYLHGNDRNISHIQDITHAMLFHELGYNLLLIDYRGYGKSTGGAPSEAKVYADAEAAWDYLVKQRGSAPRHTFIFGHSLGGAIAINLAIHHPEAAGLITESTFTSMLDMGKRLYDYLPVDWLLNQRFDSLDKVSQLKIPVLFIHGTWDNYVPYEMSEQLFARAPQPKYLELITGGDHGNSDIVGWVAYRSAFSAFIRKYAH